MLSLALFVLTHACAVPQDAGASRWVPVSSPSFERELSIERGEGEPALVVRHDEVLTYVVEMDIGPFKGISVGQSGFRSRVVDSVEGEIGYFEAVFEGEQAGYVLDHRLRSRHHPSGDPKFESFDTQQGSENRKRQIRVQRGEDGFTEVYRFDGHCKGCEDQHHFVDPKWPWGKRKHCESKCKTAQHRVWQDPVSRSVPEHSLDYLSSIYLIRSLVRSDAESLGTPLLDKNRLWNLKLIKAEKKKIEVPLGEFACQRVLIEAQRPESESGGGKFRGLFGMKGSMKFWVHEKTGVLVQISGELPLGPLDLGVKIRLKEAQNAPEGLIALGR